MDDVRKKRLLEQYRLMETDPRSVSPSGVFSGVCGWRACAALVLAYCNNPEDVDWSDIQGALEEALKAFDMPPDFPELIYRMKQEEEERAREKAAETPHIFDRFPRAEWMRLVAANETTASYNEWIIQQITAAGKCTNW